MVGRTIKEFQFIDNFKKVEDLYKKIPVNWKERKWYHAKIISN